MLLRALSEAGAAREFDFVIVGSATAMSEWIGLLSLDVARELIDVGDAHATPGRPTVEGARASLASIERAADMCRTGQVDAMVTAPVSKSAISALVGDFRGHTEFLAELTGAPDVVMTFVHGTSRIGLATTHLALSDVPNALSRALLVSKLRTLDAGLRSWLGVDDPVIAVAALNPHAGENGKFGDEEATIIGPAIAEAVSLGVRAEGPFPADALMVGESGRAGSGGAFDAALAMYHDQGTIPAKLLAGGGGVNLTIGLPIVRASVDHGTAYDIAGTGEADARSMSAALALAGEISRRLAA